MFTYFNYTVFWLIVLVLCLLIEAITLGLTTIWFSFGALSAWIFSLITDNVLIQLTVFFVVSFIMLYFTRPIAIKYLKIGHTKTNYEGLIGQKAVVLSVIDNIHDKGIVKVNGQTWTARSINNDIIQKDAIVTIKEIKGVKLIVELNSQKS